MTQKLFFLMNLLLLLVGCASYPIGPSGGTESLDQLRHIRVPPQTGHPQHQNFVQHIFHKQPLSSMRSDLIADTAMSLGARAGLAWRAHWIDRVLTANEKELDATYDFYGLLLAHDVLPPVLVQARNLLNLADPLTIRLAQKTYRIVEQAHFVTAPPTWRDYIWLSYDSPDFPDNTLLPRNKVEAAIWKHYVTIGWENGITQANNIFEANLNRLNRDYNGMILYKILYRQNIVSAPFVAKTSLGITGNSNQMYIGDKVLRIVALPELNLNGNSWNPILVPTPTAEINMKRKLYQQLKLAETPEDTENG